MFNEDFALKSWFYHDKPDLDAGELLFLEPEPDNEEDPFAVRIATLEGDLAGYVPALMSEKVTEFLASGVKLEARALDGYDKELDIAPRVRITDPEGKAKQEADEQAAAKRHRRSGVVTFGGLAVGIAIALASFVQFPDLGAMGLQILAGLVVAGASFFIGLIMS